MLQTWQRLTFLHWRYHPAVIGPLLPAHVTLDTFDGDAWVGLTPFLLTNLRAPFLPAVPWISRFPETNVRTYVIGPDGERGVWFFTLEADRLLAVLGARVLYRLPYRWADMQVTFDGALVKYESDRKHLFGHGRARIVIEPGEPIVAADLDNFLTARFRLYTTVGKRLAYAEIEHPPWPLHRARVRHLEQDLLENCGLPPPAGDPAVHYSPTLDVRIDRLRLV